MLTIYIAAHDQPKALELRQALLDYPPLAGKIEFSSSWMDKPNQTGYGKAKTSDEYRESAEADYGDVFESDLLILLSDGGGAHSPGGKHVEMGLAIGLDIPVLVYGPKENVFHHLSNVRNPENFEQLVHLIGDHVLWEETDEDLARMDDDEGSYD